MGLALVHTGCGGGGGSLKGIDNDGNDFVEENQDIIFLRQAAVSPDGANLVLVDEFEHFADAVDDDGQPVNSNNERSALYIVPTASLHSGPTWRLVRVPKNPWAVWLSDNNTAYVAADTGRLSKVSLTTATQLNVVSGLGNLRAVITNPAGTKLFAATSKGEIHIINNVDQVSSTQAFGAKTTLKVAAANFVALRYATDRNQVVATDYTGRVFLVDALTDKFVEVAATGSRVELLAQSTPESPLVYKLQQGETKPFAAFEPVLGVTSLKAGAATANQGATLSIDHDGDAGTANITYAWKFDTTTGELRIYRGTATTAGNEITAPLVEKGKTLKAADLKLDLTLADRFYTGNKYNAIAAEIVRQGGKDWLFFTGQSTTRADGAIDDPNVPGSTDRDNQFQVYELALGGPLPVATLNNCTPGFCMKVGQSPRDMRLKLNAAGTVGLFAIPNYEDNDLSFIRFDFALGEITGVDFDGNGADIVRISSGGTGPWSVAFSPTKKSVYVSHLQNGDHNEVPIPAALVVDF